jgi:AcrR family transcriptional regulator
MAASAVFARLGYERSTMADIAREAKTTRPTVYAYFASKEAIFTVLTEQLRDTFVAIQDVPDDLSPAEIIRHADIEYLRAYTSNLALLTIISHQSLGDPAMQGLWEEVHGRANRRHLRFLERLVENGVADPVAPLETISEAITGLVMRFSQLVAADPSRFDALGDDMVTLHLSMLGLRR